MAKEEGSAAATKKPKKKKSSKNNRSSRRNPETPWYSYIVKPKELSLEQWQTALRRQVAEKEDFVIHSIDDQERDRHGYYSIKKIIYETLRLQKGHDENTVPKPIGYGPEHTVVYRGDGSKWNYCSCMDFKASVLGTCKHIEAVKMWIEDNRKSICTTLPQVSSLYIDYKDQRKIKLRVGQDNMGEILTIANRYFDDQGVPYDNDPYKMMDFIRQVRHVSPSFRCYDDVLELLNEQFTKNNLQSLSKVIDDKLINSLLKTNLYPYQLEGIRFAFSTGRCIIADEMGLGKTIQAIGTAELLKHFHLASSVLIVCPTSLKYQWKFEIEKFTNSSVTVIEGNPPKRQKLYESDPAFYKIVSYNTMANDIKYNGQISADLIIMDEVQRLKNWNTIIAKAARHLKSSFSVILSGTPLENKLEELYSIVELVDQYYLGPYYRFRNQYIKTDENGMTIGYVNLNSIGESLKGILIRRQKKEVALQMPSRQDKTLYVPMTPKQIAWHQDLELKLSILIERWRHIGFLSELDRQRLLLLLSQMRMVANSTFILDQETRHDTKINETMSILEDIFESSDDKVVIFSGWERMTRLIAMELDKMGVKYSYLHGGIPSVKRRGLVENFTQDPDCRVFLSTDAGATGLNLQAGSIIINLELPWNPAVLEQRIGRIYRLGQLKNIQVINMVSTDSIEKAIEEKIRFKSALFQGILDNGQDSVFLSDKSKFEELMETLSSFIGQDEEGQNQKEADTQTPAETDPDLEGDTLEKPLDQTQIPDESDSNSDPEAEAETEEETDEEFDSEETEEDYLDEGEEEIEEDLLDEEEVDTEEDTISAEESNSEGSTEGKHTTTRTTSGEGNSEHDGKPEGSTGETSSSSSSSTSTSSTSAATSSTSAATTHSNGQSGSGTHSGENNSPTNQPTSSTEDDLRSSNEERVEREMMDQDDVDDTFPTATGSPASTSRQSTGTASGTGTAAATPADLVAQGISFFSGLAQTLSSPQKTKELVDTIVKTDEKTGRTTLEIPVPDKSTVNTLLSTIGALFANIGR